MKCSKHFPQTEDLEKVGRILFGICMKCYIEVEDVAFWRKNQTWESMLKQDPLWWRKRIDDVSKEARVYFKNKYPKLYKEIYEKQRVKTII